MAELRSVDPNRLRPNPDNPRRTPVPQAMEEQLLASITAIGIIQPPVVKEADGQLVVIAGNRRVKAAIAAGFGRIDVVVAGADDAGDAMKAVSENLIRASLTSVDIWKATEALEARGWNEQAIADALALPPRTVRRLKLLAHLHPPMLDVMAGGNMPTEDQLRTIAAATREEQAQVWKKHKPKKGQDVTWYEIARALAKRRMSFAAAEFGDDLAKAYGVVWEDDLFAPAGEDARTTTNVAGFFGAQQEWLQANLPERGTLLTTDESGRYTLPKRAEHVYGKAARGDVVGYYLDASTGAVKSVTYRIPRAKQAAKAGKGAEPAAVCARPDITTKGRAIIGDLRTDALHQALRDAPIEDDTLLALLVLALGARNIAVHSGAGLDRAERSRICAAVMEGGVLTPDLPRVRAAARAMLTVALSCRDNMSNSGVVARVAGDAIGAAVFLPNMATDTFLPCLSRAALERAASAAGLRVEVRAKDTRARLIERFKSGTYVHPEAAFGLTADELAELDGERRIAADNDAQETGAAAADDPAASDLDGAGNDPADDDDPSLRDAVSDGLDAAAD